MTEVLNHENATHELSCKHCVGRNFTEYKMKCHILKIMEDGRLKILVFGDRNWSGKEHISRIRYVKPTRINPAPNDKSSKH